jgi:hypothetical protein
VRAFALGSDRITEETLREATQPRPIKRGPRSTVMLDLLGMM